MNSFRRRTKAYYLENGGKRYGYNKAKVWLRDNYRCVECGSKKYTMIHHIIPYDENEPLTTRIENLVVLCRKCHSKIHSQGKLQKPFKLPNKETLKRIGFDIFIDNCVKELEERKNGNR